MLSRAAESISSCGPGPLNAAEVEQFERLGYAMIDTPFSEEWLDAAGAAWGRATDPETQTVTVEDRGYIESIAHPFFEDVAKQMLRSDSVYTIEHGFHARPPSDAAAQHAGTVKQALEEHDAQAEWDGGCHIDWQVTEADFDATPRRDLLALWLWLNDVPAERAAMRILPGSHRRIGKHLQETLKPERHQWTPRHHPLFPNPSKGYPTFPEYLPAPDDFAYIGEAAGFIPAIAKRGQLQVFTQAMCVNVDLCSSSAACAL